MKLIQPEVIDITQTDFSLKGIHKQIELAGRTCYKSEDKITEDSAEPFVKMLEDRGHTAMLEHGTVYLRITDNTCMYEADRLFYNPHSRTVLGTDKYIYITTNLRVINELGLKDKLLKSRYLKHDKDMHVPRYSFRIICSISIGRELTRHRVFSFAQESTRYCNYCKEKFGGISFIQPHWYKDANDLVKSDFKSILSNCEEQYFTYIEDGLKPQDAREILPLATKTEIVMTGTLPQWIQFLHLRLSSAAHPDMRIIAGKIKELISKNPLTPNE